jgi:acetylglutamate kinase
MSTPKFLINAFYESKFKDNLFVIKAGGRVAENPQALDDLMHDIRALTLHGIKVILIYGAGAMLDDTCAKRAIPVTKDNGRRVTDSQTLEIMQEIVGGKLSLTVSSAMARAGLDGLSLNVVPPDWAKVTLRAKEPVDFGFVGDIQSVEPRPIHRLLKVNPFVACACLAMTQDGQCLNINADTIATRIAIAAGAQKLIFLSDVDGVQANSKNIEILTAEEIPDLLSSGQVTGGMAIKLENCLQALTGGVRRVHLISGLRRHALHTEIYESTSPGTMLFCEAERQNYLNEIATQALIEQRR